MMTEVLFYAMEILDGEYCRIENLSGPEKERQQAYYDGMSAMLDLILDKQQEEAKLNGNDGGEDDAENL